MCMEQVQKDLERHAIERGIARFRDRQRKVIEQNRPEDGASVQRLMREVIDPCARLLQDVLDDAASGRPGRHHASVAYLAHLSPAQCAFLTGKTIFHECLQHGGKRRLQRVCLAVGKQVVTEALASDFKKGNPKAYASAVKLASKSSSARRARTVLIYCAHKSGVVEQSWPEQVVYAVGYALVDAFLQSTGLIEIQDVTEGARMGYISMVTLTPACAEWLAQSDAILELARPLQTPMVVPPRPWVEPWGGGYLLPQMRAGCAIHTQVQGFKADLKNHWAKFRKHFDAVNRLQEVGWKINEKLLNVARTVWAQGGGLTDCIPTKTAEPLPPKPQDIDTNDVARRAWRKDAAKVYERECARMSNCISAGRIVDLAEDCAQFPQIYFPMYADFRGRLYTLQNDLSPQGCDLAKGLLDFAEGAPIESDIDVFWMAINGANLYGIDKIALEDRVQWVSDNEQNIRLAVADPLGAGQAFWTAADGGDKAWQWLAWAFEWVQVLDHGFGTITYRRVDLDGSCNGLQHFAALLRDKTTGAAVNLIPSEKPNDLYQQIADRLKEKLQSIAADESIEQDTRTICRQWVEWGIDRKLTKRPVMVLPYGGTITSTRTYVRLAYRDGVKKQGKPDYWPELSDLRAAGNILSTVMWQVLAEALPAAINAMKWLQGAAAACNKKNLPVQWTAPSGFVVHQAYPELSEYRIELYTPAVISKAKPRRLTLVGAPDEPKIHKRQQRQGVSPNFVHSLDASHLVDLVLEAHKVGITSIAVVHDAYGCLAPQAEQFFRLIRETFVAMYQTDILENFRKEISRMTGTELPAAEMSNDLDVSRIMESDFAFA